MYAGPCIDHPCGTRRWLVVLTVDHTVITAVDDQRLLSWHPPGGQRTGNPWSSHQHSHSHRYLCLKQLLSLGGKPEHLSAHFLYAWVWSGHFTIFLVNLSVWWHSPRFPQEEECSTNHLTNFRTWEHPWKLLFCFVKRTAPIDRMVVSLLLDGFRNDDEWQPRALIKPLKCQPPLS